MKLDKCQEFVNYIFFTINKNRALEVRKMSSLLKIINVIQNARGREYPKINADVCVGCGTCKKACHHNAITGQLKEVHLIEIEKCARCHHCMEKCPKGAIVLGK